MTALVIAEHDNQTPAASTLAAISATKQLADDVRVLVAGYQCAAVAEALQSISGVSEVLLADHEVYQHQLAESMVPLIKEVAGNASHIVAPATTFGKNMMPRLAAQLGVGQVSDVINIIDAHTYQRPIYAGNAIATVKSHDKQQIITVRPTAFELAEKTELQAKLVAVDFVAENSLSTFVDETWNSNDRPELTSADIVIAGGRGLQDKQRFERLVALANKLDAAVGASRAAVDAELAPNDWQVGQTGKVVAPTLYIAMGISGAIQHVAGMKDSKVIVAINKDAEAPIFAIADYGLVADVDDVLSQWEKLE